MMRFGNSSSSSGSLFSGGLFGGPHPQKESSICSMTFATFLTSCRCASVCIDVSLCTSLCYPRSSSSGGLFSGSGPKLPQPSEQKGWAACSGIAFGEPKAGHGTCSNQHTEDSWA